MGWDLDITFLVPGLPFQGDTLETKSLGGSETAGLCLARELAGLGHHVTVFSNTDRPGVYDGVTYLQGGAFGDYATSAPHDVTVIQRAPEAFAARMASRLNILWCHDLALMRQAPKFKSVLWNVDKVAVVSQYMADQYREVYGLPAEMLWQTRNGIELARFDGLAHAPRDRKKLFYAARPERGLDVLLANIFPRLLKDDPTLQLHIAAYDNQVEHLRAFYQHVDGLIRQLGDRVVFHGALTKRALYEHLATSGVYVYPTPSSIAPGFAEVSCIAAMEAQAAGLPIVTSARGALGETIASGAGVLIEGDPSSPAYAQAFADAVLRYVRDDDAWRAASHAGRRQAARLDWRGVAEEWAATCERLIRERNGSPHRLVQQFVRRSDIMAAREVLRGLDDPHAAELSARIERDWSFTDSRDGVREQYEKIGQTHTDVFDAAAREPRFTVLERWLRDHPDVQRVLDFGCAHGAYSVNLANRVGREWVGVDVDRHSIDWAERNRTSRALRPESLAYVVGDDQVDLSDRAPFDCLVAFEVLEHVTDPTAVLDRLERWVKPDGYVLITVPYGPWEYMSYETYPHRCHLWEFDAHDLRELFGKKRDLRIHAMPVGACEELGEPLGWHVIEYRVDGTPTGRIDMERKLALQRPRETVSALLIAGAGAEETLHWCLRAAKVVADEIVIADTGMTEEGRRIATGYGARLVAGSDPREHGFETPRNEGLAACRMDWVLWVDTDEKLIDAQKLNKYLRPNIFDGYSIRQHHFAVDTGFNPDLPVRCFRRRPRTADGKALRWYGMIHEHPEYALNEGPGLVIVLSDVHIAHVGYLVESGRRKKFGRNWPLLQKDIATYPDRILQKHFICRDEVLRCQWELGRNGGVITPAIRECLERVKTLFREHFLGKGHSLNTETLQYYSQALAMLGEGVEVAWSVGAGKDQATPGPVIRARFASYEEAQQELGWRTRDAMAAFESPWW